MLGVLIFGWFLTLFNLDTKLVYGINEVFGTNFSINIYWLIVIVVAIFAYIVEKANRHNK